MPPATSTPRSAGDRPRAPIWRPARRTRMTRPGGTTTTASRSQPSAHRVVEAMAHPRHIPTISGGQNCQDRTIPLNRERPTARGVTLRRLPGQSTRLSVARSYSTHADVSTRITPRSACSSSGRSIQTRSRSARSSTPAPPASSQRRLAPLAAGPRRPPQPRRRRSRRQSRRSPNRASHRPRSGPSSACRHNGVQQLLAHRRRSDSRTA